MTIKRFHLSWDRDGIYIINCLLFSSGHLANHHLFFFFDNFGRHFFLKSQVGNSLMVQWLGLRVFTAVKHTTEFSIWSFSNQNVGSPSYLVVLCGKWCEAVLSVVGIVNNFLQGCLADSQFLHSSLSTFTIREKACLYFIS